MEGNKAAVLTAKTHERMRARGAMQTAGGGTFLAQFKLAVGSQGGEPLLHDAQF